MPTFPWKPEYSVNIRAIDAQHQQLVTMINNLHDAMAVGRGREVVGGLLAELIDYTKNHFADEERLLQANSYPGLLAHQAEHRRLIQQVLEYQRQWQSGAQVSIDLARFLKDWLINHILKTDMQYSPYLAGKGVV